MLYALRGAYLSKVHDGLKRYTICKMVDHMCGMYIFGTQQNCVLYYLHPSEWHIGPSKAPLYEGNLPYLPM